MLKSKISKIFHDNYVNKQSPKADKKASFRLLLPRPFL